MRQDQKGTKGDILFVLTDNFKRIVSEFITTPFYDMNQKILTPPKKKGLFPKLSVDSNFKFTSYA